ncbi:MAG TPA: VOC family protein [Arachidicoccus sp.]|nr:VOC family protein [Arachidicoccus sp.]
MLDIKRIHHVAILTGDYETSKQFYTEILGFKILAEVYREQRDSFKLDLAVGDRYQIELFSFPDFKPRASYPEAKGLRHLAFEVENVEQSIADLRAAGVEVEDARTDCYTGKKYCFFLDPNGQPLELYEL